MAVPKEVTFRLSRSPRSVPRARALLLAMLDTWQVGQDVTQTAELLLSELVTNALQVPVPRDRQVGILIARSEEDGLLRLEVSDAGSGRPEVKDPGVDETGGRGLLLVEALAHRWGVRDRAYGIGKTVWAELKAPDIVATPAARRMAAVTIQPGQQVRLRGRWHTVHGVRADRTTSGGVAIVLDLDDGPRQRVNAAEPLTVRDSDGRG